MAIVFGCDTSSSLSEVEPVIEIESEDPEPEKCPSISLGKDQFAFRIHNTSPWAVDSTVVRFTKQNGDSPSSIYFGVSSIQPNSFSCPKVYNLTYERTEGRGGTRWFAYFHVNPWTRQYLRYPRHHKFQFEPETYTYRLVLNKYTEFYNRSIVMAVDDFSHPTLGVRIVNKMNLVVRNLKIYYPDTVLVIPELPPNSETDYFKLQSTYRYARVKYDVGNDAIDHSPIDFVGERLYYSGRFRMEIDSLQFHGLLEEGFAEHDPY